MVRDLPEHARVWAELQDGVLNRTQVLAAGLTDEVIRARVRGGRWRALGRGVYVTFTGPMPRRSLLWAAVLQAGCGAMLSHQSAAEADGLTDTPSSPIHVTVPARRRVDPIPGVRVYLCGRAEQKRDPLVEPPRTRVEETVLDLADAARSFDDAFGWVCRAVSGRFTTTQRLRAAMENRSRMGRRVGLEVALADVEQGVHSVLELLYLRIERAHGLPRASRQARVVRGGRTQYRDCFYEAYRVVVELDGRVAHPDETAWRDMRRDNAGAEQGVLTLRYGYADLTERPCQVAAQVAVVLQSRGWTGTPRKCRSERMSPGR
jgi:very-short-patch-repair endonuclease